MTLDQILNRCVQNREDPFILSKYYKALEVLAVTEGREPTNLKEKQRKIMEKLSCLKVNYS